MRRRLRVTVLLTLAGCLGATLAQSVLPLDAQTTRQPAVRGVLPNGPVFAPDRPKPPAGSVLDIESLVVAPSDDFRMERRNNFYKKDGSDGLYRWAASGHWSNYDESKTAGWQKSVPDPLRMNDGQVVRDAETWRTRRRPEIVNLVETHVYGKVPANVPRVAWTPGELTTSNVNGIETRMRTATGRYVNLDGSPAVGMFAQRGDVGVDRGPAGVPEPPRASLTGVLGGSLTVTYTIPANARGRVPLIQGANAQRVLSMGFGTVSFGGRAPDVFSVSPTRDDWGAIRKYAWIVSRGLDYLETDPLVDAHKVALSGHSIGGKQALLAAALDERIALVFASCSGEGGASMMRRDWGETIDDLAQLSPQNYAENFQNWVGHWSEMPIDAHFLVALMAPRPVFITGGTQDQWSDPVGVFWAGYYASPVYALLGKRGFSVSQPPAPGTWLDGDVTYLNHVGGHITTAEETEKYLEVARTRFAR